MVIAAEEYTPYEQVLAEQIDMAGQKSSHLGEVALGVGAGFFLYRAYMKRRVREELASNPVDGVDGVIRIVNLVAQAYMPRWVPTLAISLGVGYTQGVLEAGAMRTDPEWVAASAARYAQSMGQNIHAVSAEAVRDGIQAQINRGVPFRVATDRVINSFGVAPRSMNALVNLWTKAPTKRTTTRPVKGLADQIDNMIAKALSQRAQTIGKTEAVLSKNVAKALYWTYMQQMGQIPKDATKKWITADDERVCPVCGPLDGVEVPVDAPFEVDDQKLMAPGVHPRCRCEIRLVSPFLGWGRGDKKDYVLAKSAWGVVSKAVGRDEFDRDASGRFAERESRSGGPRKPNARLKVYEGIKPREVNYADPRAQEIVQETESRLKPGLAESKLKPGLKLALKPALKQEEKLRSGGLRKERSLYSDRKLNKEQKLRLEQASLAEGQRMRTAMLSAEDEFADDIQDKEQAFHYMTDRSGANYGMFDLNTEHDFTEDENYEVMDTVLGYASDTFLSMVNFNEGALDEEEWGSWEDAREEEGGYDAENPSEEWLKANDERYTPRQMDEEYESTGEPLIRVSYAGMSLYLSEGNIQDLVLNTYLGRDDVLDEIRWGMGAQGSHSGHVPSGAHEERSFTTSELLEVLGQAGQELAFDVTQMRPVDVVVDGYNYDEDDFDPTQAPGFEDLFEEMAQDPFDESWTTKSVLYSAYERD